ncbi:hypothetical protein [Microcystis phage Mwe-JY05]
MRCRAVVSAALLAVLAGGGAAYAGDYTPETPAPRPECTPLQTQNLLGGAQVCPIDADVAPVVTLPVVLDLQ